MPIETAVNGPGGIGRTFFWVSVENPELASRVHAFNYYKDDPESIYGHLTSDSIYGYRKAYKLLTLNEEGLHYGTRKIYLFTANTPDQIPWEQAERKLWNHNGPPLDIIIEATRNFNDPKLAEGHLLKEAAHHVLLASTPKNNPCPISIPGVNLTEDILKTRENKVISGGTCSSNCLLEALNILYKKIGLKGKLIAHTTHNFTGDDQLYDRPGNRRSVFNNIVPDETGAKKTVGLVLPELVNSLDGRIFVSCNRVGVSQGSLFDIWGEADKDITARDIIEVFEDASGNDVTKGIVGIKDKMTSADVKGRTEAMVIARDTIEVSPNHRDFHAQFFYDTLTGFSAQLARTGNFINQIHYS